MNKIYLNLYEAKSHWIQTIINGIRIILPQDNKVDICRRVQILALVKIKLGLFF